MEVRLTDDSGFTLVEVLVSLIVLAVGLLAIMSTLASGTRSMTAGFESVVTSARAAEVLESVRVGDCGKPSAGSESDGAMELSWRLDPVGLRLGRVTVVISSGRLRSRADTFSSIFPC